MTNKKYKIWENETLVWGYSTIFFSLLTYLFLRITNNEISYILYIAVPITAMVVTFFAGKKDKQLSETEQLINNIWLTFGLTVLLICIGRYFIQFPLFPLVALLIGLETIITGLIRKRTQTIVGGIVGIIGAIPLLLVTGYEQNIIFAIVFALMSVIPEYINRK